MRYYYLGQKLGGSVSTYIYYLVVWSVFLHILGWRREYQIRLNYHTIRSYIEGVLFTCCRFDAVYVVVRREAF